jgi:hypothetical protein
MWPQILLVRLHLLLPLLLDAAALIVFTVVVVVHVDVVVVSFHIASTVVM